MGNKNKKTHFGYQEVNEADKSKYVGEVFTSVAKNYDIMNDAMSFGMHRLWKKILVELAAVGEKDVILDIASGTGDIAKLISKEYPNKITIELNEYDKIMTITDLRGSVPKKSTLYKNMIEIESDEIFLIPSLTITNGPVPTGFNGEMVSLIMTLKSYNLDVNSFNFTYDGDFFIGEYRSTLIDFGKPLDLGSKSSALGSLIENSDCQGEIRFISKEDIIANCS